MASDLQEAVARAIADVEGCDPMCAAEFAGVCTCREAAAAAIRVCMAEAQRAVEALRPELLSYQGDLDRARAIVVGEALAALAALAEEGVALLFGGAEAQDGPATGGGADA
jgi:hypothetical protein